MQNQRLEIENSKLSTDVKNVILSSWKDSTKEQYLTYLKQWEKYCKSRLKNPFTADVAVGLEFLNIQRKKGLGYSAINTARSALSSIMSRDKAGNEFGSHPLVCRFMKGVFQQKPALPRYSNIWDPNIVLNFLSRMSPRKRLTLKGLTEKVAALLALLTVQRVQTLHLIKLENISFNENQVQIVISDLLKTSRPNYHLEPLVFEKFDHKSLCVVRYLKTYISKTRKLRGAETQLFISFIEPHKAVTRSTISRWIRDILSRSGIDTSMFKAHSTRAASASKVSKFLPIEKVLKAGGWSSCNSYAKHYKLPCVSSAASLAMLS